MPSRKHGRAVDCAVLSRPYRRVSGPSISRRQITYALRLLRARKLCRQRVGFIPRNLSYRNIAKSVGVHSPTTIMRWNHQDMSAGNCRFFSRYFLIFLLLVLLFILFIL